MTNDIIISVIINAYNYGIYIEDAIVSALQQTLPRSSYEIIVIDDGSTDDTRLRVEKYLQDVIYYYKDNGGQASALNSGLALARGKFVAFLDADDYWHPDKLKDVLERFSSDSTVDVVYHALRLVDETNSPRGVIPSAIRTNIVGRAIENNMRQLTSVGSATSGIAWRIYALRGLLPIPETYRLCADSFLMICAPLVARKFVMIAAPLGSYRLHGKNGYSEIGLTSSAVNAKSQALAAHYRSLCLNDLVLLAAKFECQEFGLIRELKVICFSDKLLAIKNHSGLLGALRELWRSRIELACLPLKRRIFRSATIILTLFISFRFYRELHNICVNSPLWFFVQRYVKNDIRFIPSESQPVWRN